MIDKGSGIEAFIRPFDAAEQYHEYTAPRQSPLYARRANTRYIEAVNGERFEICVVIPKSFSFRRQPDIAIWCSIDGQDDDDEDGAHDSMYWPEADAKTAPIIFRQTSWKDDNGWHEAGWVFRQLDIDEDIRLSKDDEEREVSERGRIRVKLQLGKKTVEDAEYSYESTQPRSHATSKKVAIDRARSHGVELVPLSVEGESIEEYDQDWSWTPARGKKGRTIEFTLFYASRMVLELKNIVPAADQLAQPSKESEIIRSRTASPVVVISQPPEAAIEVIDLCEDNDDEVALAPIAASRILKKQERADHDTLSASVSAARKRLKTEHSDRYALAGSTLNASSASAELAMQRERARIELKLEENKLRQQLMDLDEKERAVLEAKRTPAL